MAEERFTSLLKENWLEPINHKKNTDKVTNIYINRQKCLMKFYFITGKVKAVLKYDPEN